MKKYIVTAAIIALSTVLLCSCDDGRPGDVAARVVHVDGTRARELVASGATLLDVRTEAEFRARHVEGARNIPVQALESRLAELGAGAPVVVYCQSGGRSAQAARVLVSAGFTPYDLGPMSSW